MSTLAESFARLTLVYGFRNNIVGPALCFFLVQLIVRLRRFLGSDVLSKSRRGGVGGSQILTNVLTRVLKTEM